MVTKIETSIFGTDYKKTEAPSADAARRARGECKVPTLVEYELVH